MYSSYKIILHLLYLTDIVLKFLLFPSYSPYFASSMRLTVFRPLIVQKEYRCLLLCMCVCVYFTRSVCIITEDIQAYEKLG